MLTESGGTAPYAYAWSNGSSDESLSAGPGDYTVQVTDANGCQVDSETWSIGSGVGPTAATSADAFTVMVGKDYFFVSKEKFDQMVEYNELLEHAKVFGNHYGTPLMPVEKALANIQDIIFDIDWQGTQQLKQKLVNDLMTVFILPPSQDELERRLRSRQQDDEAIITERMKKASDEISHYSEYDYIIVNHDLNRSILTAQSILEAERSKRRRITDLPNFVRTLMGDA